MRSTILVLVAVACEPLADAPGSVQDAFEDTGAWEETPFEAMGLVGPSSETWFAATFDVRFTRECLAAGCGSEEECEEASLDELRLVFDPSCAYSPEDGAECLRDPAAWCDGSTGTCSSGCSVCGWVDGL